MQKTKYMLEFLVDNISLDDDSDSPVREQLYALCQQLIEQEAEKVKAKFIADAMAKLSGKAAPLPATAACKPKCTAKVILLPAKEQETPKDEVPEMKVAPLIRRKKRKINPRPEHIPEKYKDLTLSELRRFSVGEDMLLDYNITPNMKYIPTAYQSWVVRTFGTNSGVLAALTRICKKVSEDLDIGYTLVKNEEFDPESKYKSQHRIGFAAPVFLEVKRRYENCELSPIDLKTLRTAELKKIA